MLAAILGFLGSLVSALPKLLETIRDWKKADAVSAEQASKDTRNDEAIRKATGGDPTPPRA